MERFLLSSSKGLAELAKGKTITAQFIHESVRNFLIDQGGLGEICGDHESLQSTAHEQLKKCCLRGMAFDLPRQLEQRESSEQLRSEYEREDERSSLRARYPFAEYATTYLLHHADRAAIGISQQHFLANEFAISDWISRFNALKTPNYQCYSGTPSFWYLCAENNFARLMTQATQPTDPMSREAQKHPTPLMAAIMHSSWEVLRLFFNGMHVPDTDEIVTEIRSGSTRDQRERYEQRRSWSWAALNGLTRLSKLLLKSLSEEQFNFQAGHALQSASTEGNVKAVQILIDAGANLNAREGISLHKASFLGHEKVVQMLVCAGAKVNTKGGPSGNALQVASEKGHARIVQMLIDADVNSTAHKISLRRALQAASVYGHEEVVQILIDTGADVNAQASGLYSNALQAALVEGHKKVVQMLIAAGAI
jgi:ankyrin repeat protein